MRLKIKCKMYERQHRNINNNVKSGDGQNREKKIEINNCKQAKQMQTVL